MRLLLVFVVLTWSWMMFYWGFYLGINSCPAPPPIQRLVTPTTPAQLLTCPVTHETIEEYRRECRGRARAELTSIVISQGKKQ